MIYSNYLFITFNVTCFCITLNYCFTWMLIIFSCLLITVYSISLSDCTLPAFYITFSYLYLTYLALNHLAPLLHLLVYYRFSLPASRDLPSDTEFLFCYLPFPIATRLLSKGEKDAGNAIRLIQGCLHCPNEASETRRRRRSTLFPCYWCLLLAMCQDPEKRLL